MSWLFKSKKEETKKEQCEDERIQKRIATLITGMSDRELMEYTFTAIVIELIFKTGDNHADEMLDDLEKSLEEDRNGRK